jgi:hypothetical protein
MKRIAYLILVATLSGCASASLPVQTCQIPGDYVQWRADYCLFKSETDDIIAASSCLEYESRRLFRSSCTGKIYYKRSLCELAIAAGQRSDSVDSCLKDPLFIGPTVRNGGA